MFGLFTRLRDAIQGKAPISSKRSNSWGRVRAAHLRFHPTCEVCGGSDKLEVHHIKPYHAFPELELERTNLITMCSARRNGMDCHLTVGHLGDYRSANATVAVDSQIWQAKFRERKVL